MSTKFKDFGTLNRALQMCKRTETYNKLRRLLDTPGELVNIASNVPSEFARSYSQVQWMKYDANGDPDDVTPDEQSSAADSVLSAAREKALSLQELIDENEMVSSSETIEFRFSNHMAISDGAYKYSMFLENSIVYGLVWLNISRMLDGFDEPSSYIALPTSRLVSKGLAGQTIKFMDSQGNETSQILGDGAVATLIPINLGLWSGYAVLIWDSTVTGVRAVVFDSSTTAWVYSYYNSDSWTGRQVLNRYRADFTNITPGDCLDIIAQLNIAAGSPGTGTGCITEFPSAQSYQFPNYKQTDPGSMSKSYSVGPVTFDDLLEGGTNLMDSIMRLG